MKYIFFSAFCLLALLCVSVFIFDPTHLYYELRWLDIPMHILGGLGVAALSWSVSRYQGKKVSYVTLFSAYLCVAIAWELYEYVHDLVLNREWNGWFDTIKDLIDGALGVVVFFFIQKK